jgi:hypothetical protein
MVLLSAQQILTMSTTRSSRNKRTVSPVDDIVKGKVNAPRRGTGEKRDVSSKEQVRTSVVAAMIGRVLIMSDQ